MGVLDFDPTASVTHKTVFSGSGGDPVLVGSTKPVTHEAVGSWGDLLGVKKEVLV